MSKNVLLIILDGLGIGPNRESNAFYKAQPKFLVNIFNDFPTTSLQASGISVGLPWGEEGSCEAGHLTIGAGKIYYQNYPKITMAIKDGSFFNNQVLKNAFDFCKNNNTKINFVGLLSQGIAESSIDHILALIKMAESFSVDFKLHLFADGENSPPRSFLNLLSKLPKEKLASISGRYYVLDNNNNFNLIKRAYDCLVGNSYETPNYEDFIKNHYQKNMNDNTIPPILINKENAIQENEAVVFFNFREDNITGIVEPFINKNFENFEIKIFNNLFIVTMTEYFEGLNQIAAFPKEKITNPLSKVLAQNNKTQFKIAENSKYPLITYFFNGLTEEAFQNEIRVSIPQSQYLNPVENPGLNSEAITHRLIDALENKIFDFYLVNYGNFDILGHLGNFNAIIKSINIIDSQIEKIVNLALKNDITTIITSDHGNIEQMINPLTGYPHTEHTKNPVPLCIIDKKFKGRKFPNFLNLQNETLGLLSDVAPTILEILDIPQPKEMTGQSLLSSLF
jgi:2,3-bisphosphoglycerate-independent phosphoglycerate mutase